MKKNKNSARRILAAASCISLLLMASMPSTAETLGNKLKALGNKLTKSEQSQTKTSQAASGPLRLGSLADPAATPDSVTSLLRARNGLPPGHTIRPSIVPGLFIVATDADMNDAGVCPVYVDSEVRVIANAQDRSWAEFGSFKPVGEEVLAEIRKGLAAGLASASVHMGPPEKSPFMVMFSANDCPACMSVDKALHTGFGKPGYAVIGTWLTDANAQPSHDAWCAGNPDQAWSAMMISRKMPAKTRGQCGRLTEARRMLACGYLAAVPGQKEPPVVPWAILPDGNIVTGVKPIIAALEQNPGATFAMATSGVSPAGAATNASAPATATPVANQKISTRTGPDVIGITLGTPAGELEGILKAHEAAYQLYPKVMPLNMSGVPVRKYLYGIHAIVPGAVPGSSVDQTMASLSAQSNDPRVILISRSAGFYRDQEPLIETLIQSLRGKYGKETDSKTIDPQRRRLMWAFQANGSRATPNPSLTIARCASYEGGGYGFGVTGFEMGSNQLYNRYRQWSDSGGSSSSMNQWLAQNSDCGTILTVDITAAQHNAQLVSSMETRLINYRDYLAAMTWLRADIESAKNGLQQQQVDQAKGKAAPRL